MRVETSAAAASAPNDDEIEAAEALGLVDDDAIVLRSETGARRRVLFELRTVPARQVRRLRRTCRRA
jgi:hypothetical protein